MKLRELHIYFYLNLAKSLSKSNRKQIAQLELSKEM